MKKLLLAFNIFLVFTSQAIAQIPNDGLIGHWPFTGNADDESANDNNGTVYGAALTTDRFGIEDSAYIFDGNDKIIIPHASSLDMTDSLSFSVWVHPDILTGTRMVLGKSNYSSTTNYLIRIKPGGYLQWEYGGYTETDSDPLQLSAWHHIVVTATGPGKIKKVYIDNQLVAMTDSSIGPSGIVTNPFTIGYAGYNSEYFIGAIDDLRMYGKELSTPEIEALYNETVSEIIFDDGFE